MSAAVCSPRRLPAYLAAMQLVSMFIGVVHSRLLRGAAPLASDLVRLNWLAAAAQRYGRVQSERFLRVISVAGSQHARSMFQSTTVFAVDVPSARVVSLLSRDRQAIVFRMRSVRVHPYGSMRFKH